MKSLYKLYLAASAIIALTFMTMLLAIVATNNIIATTIGMPLFTKSQFSNFAANMGLVIFITAVVPLITIAIGTYMETNNKKG